MDHPHKRANPLRYIAVALVITLPFDVSSYIVEHFFTAFGVIIILGKLFFFALYAQKSRFAWHVGLLLIASITPLSLLLIHFGSEAEKHPYSRPLFEIVVVLILVVYLWKIRQRYSTTTPQSLAAWERSLEKRHK